VHIWVYKHLLEHEVEIKELAWTSMWAIVAAMIAIKMSPDDIIKYFKNINYLKLVDLNLIFWILSGKKVRKELKKVFKDKRIEDLDIPLTIVATNIETWESEYFKSWKIVDALRASLSLPSIFTPHKINENHFIDWWITSNLPIEAIKSKHKIIAVSALRKTSPLNTHFTFWRFKFVRNFFEINYQILHRTLLLLLENNEKASIEDNPKAIIIKPDFTDILDYYSFLKLDEFVELGYEETKKVKI